MPAPWSLRTLFAGCLFLMGCQPDIGDSCNLPSDCSLSGDRLCDTTFKNGYCTQFNCEPGNCPEEAVCVAWRTTQSVAPECRDTQGGERFERTFCMKSCNDDSDCRESEGYVCIDPTEVDAWSANIVERGSFSRKVCALPYTGSPLPSGRATEVCRGGPAGDFPEPLSPSRPDAAAPPSDGGLGDGLAPDAGPVPADAPHADTGAEPLDATVDVGRGDGSSEDAAATDASRDAPAGG